MKLHNTNLADPNPALPASRMGYRSSRITGMRPIYRRSVGTPELTRLVVPLAAAVGCLAANTQARRGPHPDQAALLAKSVSLDKRRAALRKSEFDFATNTDRGGNLAWFDDRREVKIVRLTIGLSNYDVEDTFYYEEETVFLIRESFTSYRYSLRTGEPDFGHPHRDRENRFYFFRSGQILGEIAPGGRARESMGDPTALAHDGRRLSVLIVKALHSRSPQHALEAEFGKD